MDKYNEEYLDDCCCECDCDYDYDYDFDDYQMPLIGDYEIGRAHV